MQAELVRATQLLSLHRYADAENELRRVLAEQPQNGNAFSFLAVALSNQQKSEQALDAAHEGIRLSPDDDWAHYILASVLHEADMHRKAEMALHAAIEMNPETAEYWCLAASIQLALGDTEQALNMADRALELEPENTTAANLRAMALQRLNRNDEADATIGQVLVLDPNDSNSHANNGWLQMRRGNVKQAADHFREALRLDPNNDWARSGLVESLKARHLVYRYLLMFLLWLSGLSSKTQWGIVIGGYLGYRFAYKFLVDIPGLAPLAWTLIALYVAFVYLTWTGSAMFNFFLLFNRDGRLAMDEDDKNSAWSFAVLFGSAACFSAMAIVNQDLEQLIPAYVLTALTIPISVYYQTDRKRLRKAMVASIFLLSLLFAAMLTAMFTGDSPGPMLLPAIGVLFVTLIVANVMRS